MAIPFLQCNTTNFKAGRTTSIKYIVVHYTAGNGDTAKGNCNYFANNKNLSASAHYFVDEYGVYQSVSESDTAWHCGAKKYYHDSCRNSNSIGVELCSRRYSGGSYYLKDETASNAIELIKSLMAKYNIPVENVVRHYDVTHKNCPAPYVENTEAWVNFKNYLGGGVSMAKLTKYSDVPEGYWAEQQIKKLYDCGIMQGDTAGTFRPASAISRAEVACVVANLLNYLGK